VHDYDELVAAMRARANELNVSRATIDDVSGLQSGYAAKLLANPPIKSFGAVSLGPMLGALGVSLVMVEDVEALARVATRLDERNSSQVRTMPAPARMSSKLKMITKRNARKMQRLWMSKVPAAKRKAMARRAANLRWKRVRAKRRRATS
jgi:hypothetical protein